MQKIRYGRFVRKNTMPKHASKGISEPFYGWITLDDGSLVKAYIKEISLTSIINEVSAAILGELIGLNIPTPVIIRANKKKFPKGIEIGDDVLVFGSIDAGEPTLANQLPEEDIALKIISEFPATSKIMAFDELIGNPDRHTGNLLLSQTGGNVIPIDHSFGFGDEYRKEWENTVYFMIGFIIYVMETMIKLGVNIGSDHSFLDTVGSELEKEILVSFGNYILESMVRSKADANVKDKFLKAAIEIKDFLSSAQLDNHMPEELLGENLQMVKEFITQRAYALDDLAKKACSAGAS